MIWTINPDDANPDRYIAYVRDMNGKAVAAPVGLETALELVNEHNKAVFCALLTGPAAKGRNEK